MHNVYKHLLCKLQKAEDIFMTLLAADEALATEVSAWVGLLYSKWLHQEKGHHSHENKSRSLFIFPQSKNACSFNKNEEKDCEGQIKAALTMTPELWSS